jgi:signal transduction histidine kinase
MVFIRAGGLAAPETWLDRLLRTLPFVLLAVPFVPYALTQNLTGGDLARTLAVIAPTALWLGWFVVLRPIRGGGRQWLMPVYFVGFLAASAVLIARSPWFSFFCWIGFMQSVRYLTGGWRNAGIAGTAVLLSVGQTGGFHDLSVPLAAIIAAISVLNATLVVSFVIVGQRAEDQSKQRQQMNVELGEANRRLEETMAENAGLHAQLLSQAREAGVLEERQRMAREIHDTLAQGITGIITQLEAVAQSGPGADRERRIAVAAQLARDSLSEARRSVQALRPEALAANPRLPDALAEVAGQWSAVNGVTATVTTTGDPVGLHAEIEVSLLRVAQEALANAAKHAAASRVGITLSYMTDVVTLDVRDDGAGFRLPNPERPVPEHPVPERSDPERSAAASGNGDGRSGGFGLTVMRQRVQRVGGTLAIESEPGLGTAVSASVPAIPAVGGERMSKSGGDGQ